VLNNPIKLSKTPAEIKRKAPDLGEHTDTIMKELGYDPESIATMKKSGVIA
jgi:crotonobetainyl-CoA:carnitine CoA-transferase CaiB-like acyl-CoA transferase